MVYCPSRRDASRLELAREYEKKTEDLTTEKSGRKSKRRKRKEKEFILTTKYTEHTESRDDQFGRLVLSEY